jgi:hypothetical protein
MASQPLLSRLDSQDTQDVTVNVAPLESSMSTASLTQREG